MKKLARKVTFQTETVEAYYCNQCNYYCSCSCGCPPGAEAIYYAQLDYITNSSVNGSNPRIAIAQ